MVLCTDNSTHIQFTLTVKTSHLLTNTHTTYRYKHKSSTVKLFKTLQYLKVLLRFTASLLIDSYGSPNQLALVVLSKTPLQFSQNPDAPYTFANFDKTCTSLHCFTVSGLQLTDVELDERITELEENGGGGNTQNGNVHSYSNASKVPWSVNISDLKYALVLWFTCFYYHKFTMFQQPLPSTRC